jgi:hypothetical protein
MYDEEYEKLKGKFTLDKYKIENYAWNVGFLTNIKDKNNRQSFIDFINLMKQRAFQEVFDKFVEIIDKEYIKITDMPTAKELFEFIRERIKDNEESINYSKNEIVKLKKELQKETDYDKIKKLESEIFWAEHRMDEDKEEIYIFNAIKEKIIWNISYNKTKKKFQKKKR